MSRAASIFSEHWHRVASVRPRLAGHVRVDRHVVRGEIWHVLSGEDDAESLRLDAAAYAIAGRCDGRRTLGEIWDLLNVQRGDGAPTQDELIEVLVRLHERQWLEFGTAVDLDALARVKRRQDDQSRRQALNPLALRIPLVDLRRWLPPLDGLADRLYSRLGLAAWLLLVGSAAVVAVLNFQSLVAHAERWLATPRYLLLGACLYPLIKLVHELAHGLAIRRWRGQVRTAGITLLVLLPVPYVDASAANRFPRVAQRVAVSLAGIGAELAIASIGVWSWLLLEDGALRAAAFLTIVIGAVSTVAVNANPLLRFDGYFACCDLLGLPNLASRSQRFWQAIVQDRLLGGADDAQPRLAAGERRWLLAYAPLSWAYQTVLAVTIVGWLGGKSAALGTVAAAAFGWLLAARPLRWLYRALTDARLAARERSLALRRASIVAGVLVVGLAGVPVPDRTLVQGVVWVPEQAILRPGTDGFIERFAREDGAPVRAGELVAVLDNPALRAREQRLAARIAGLEIRLFQALHDDAARASRIREELRHATEEATHLAAEIAALQLHAATTGVLALPRQADLLGTYVRRGQTLGYTLTGDRPTVRVAVPQQEAARIRGAGGALYVRLAADLSTVLAATIRQDGGAAVRQLPSAALSTHYGGDILTDPADRDHRATLTPIVTVDVQLASDGDHRIGERAWVRFDHGRKPLAWQWIRTLDQWRLRHFAAAA